MVTRLSSPRLSTDSMGAGGTPHQSYGMSAPGSPGVEPGPQAFEVPDVTDLMTPSGPTVLVSDESDRIRNNGRPVQGGGWTQVKGLSR